MGIEALLHSTIHGRHGKNTGNSQSAGGESLAGGFAGLLQGHLSSTLGPSEAADDKSSPLLIDDQSTSRLADTSLSDPALLATIIPATVSAEPRPSRPVDENAPVANDQLAPTTSTSAPRSTPQDTLAAAASALDAIAPRNAAPIDGAAESTTRIAPSSNAPRTPAAPSTPIVDSGRFTDQLARATPRTAAPTRAQSDLQANRQASSEQTPTTEMPAATNAAAPTVIDGNSSRGIERQPAAVTPATQPGTSSVPQNNAEKLPPAQRKAIAQAFTSDRQNLASASANAPAKLSTPATSAANPAPPTTTGSVPPLPASNQTGGIAAGLERVSDTPNTSPPAFELESAQRPAPRPLPSAQPGVGTQPTPDADSAPEETPAVLARATPGNLQTTPAPLPNATNVPISTEMPAPAVVSAAASESLSGRRPTTRNSVQESRGTTLPPLAAASDGSDEAFAVPQTGPAIRSAAGASPVAANQPQNATIAATTDAKPESTDASSVPTDSAKLAAMPAAAANTAPPAGLAVSGEASAAQHPETTIQLATHLRDPRWGEQLGERVVVLAQGEKNSAQIDINPAQLGPIRVKIDMSGDQVSVQFSSASSEVRQVLEDALPRLREQLANSGIQLGQANVGSQSQQTPREAFAQSTPSPRSPGEGAILPAESPLEAQSSGRLIQSGRGMVDLFA